MTATHPPQIVAGCDTCAKLFAKRVAELGAKIAIREKDFGIWNQYSWTDYGEQARLAGLGLKALGLVRGDVVSVASEVNKEWLFADLGIICVGGITNGVYPTDASNQVEYLINDSGTRFYLAEDEEQLDKVLAVRDNTPTLEKIIIFDMEGLRHLDDPMCISFEQLQQLGRAHGERHPAVWDQEISGSKPEELLTLTYTSGTTGRPKGAMISHQNMLFQIQAIQWIYGINPDDEQIGFLPLAHIAGRMFYTFSTLEACSTINLVESMETINQDQQEVAPTIHFAVPRVWEKQYSAVAIMLKDATALGRLAYDAALKVGTRAASFSKKGARPPLLLRALNFVADKAVFRNIRVMLGIDQARWLSTAAAPIAPDLIEWYWAIGRPMYEVYGQTECSGLVTANRNGDQRIGSVGKVAKGAQIKLSEQGEILIRSPGVISGYWNKSEMTAETIQDGWLHSGDVGEIDDDGFVYIRDRMKDVIITAGGKNITPSEIENQLKFSLFISDSVVIGDARPYLTCLVMIDHENSRDLIGAEVERVNQKFARVETIKKFRLIDQLLDAEDEELTPTMNLNGKSLTRSTRV
nr:long-chain-fatty-acid--CoA ligase FadD15-like [Nerophis lumbriciformis]